MTSYPVKCLTKKSLYRIIIFLTLIFILSCSNGEVGDEPMVETPPSSTEPTTAPTLPSEPPPLATPTQPSIPPETTSPPIPSPEPTPTDSPVPSPEPTNPPVLPPTNPNLGAFQQDMLNAVNTARSSSRNCGGTFRPAVGMVQWNEKVEEATIIHSSDMADSGNFSHIGTDGSNPGDRLNEVGYNWRGWGENIAFRYLSIEDVMQGWLNSPDHCNNIMNPDWVEMGASEVDTYWTLLFTVPR